MEDIIAGKAGMIGEGVLLECLYNPEITEVLSISRRPAGIKHPKLKQYIIPDFLSLKDRTNLLVLTRADCLLSF